MSLTACSTPAVDVKQRWYEAFVSYSFVPIYPARSSDLNIGDVRIHTIGTPAEALDSRLISDYRENKLAGEPVFADAVLPGVEAVRLVSLDTESVGLSGLLRRLLGSRVNASSSLYISLQDLTTAEISDKDVARNFVSYLQTESKKVAYEARPGDSPETIAINSESTFFWGLCSAAKTFNDPTFNDLGISVVTRVIRAKKIAYYSGSQLSNVPDAAAPTSAPVSPTQPANVGTSAAPAAPKNPQGNTFSSLTGSSLPVVELDTHVVVGADALMVSPKVIIPGIAKRCKNISSMFVDSQLRKLCQRRNTAGGAG